MDSDVAEVADDLGRSRVGKNPEILGLGGAEGARVSATAEVHGECRRVLVQ